MPTVTYTVLDGQIVEENRNGVITDYVADPLGSTVALLGGSHSKSDTFNYWPYGEVQSRSGSTATPFQFVGTLGYYRDSSARTYVRARHYRQNMGRWQTVDPFWPMQPAFKYCSNDPTRVTDRSGTGWVEQLKCWLRDLIWPPFDPITGGLNPPAPDEFMPMTSGEWCEPFRIPSLLKCSPPPVYGNWCGPQGEYRLISPEPGTIDELDLCCYAHDKCWEKCFPPCNAANQVWSPCCKSCTFVLCACMKTAKTRSSSGEESKLFLMTIYCNIFKSPYWPTFE